MHKYLLVQTSIGDYRQGVLDKLVESLGDDFSVLAGKEYFESSTKTRVDIGSNLKIIKNSFFLKRKVLMQWDALFPSIKCDSVILELNPRIISAWLILIARMLLRKKTILWGHSWPRSGMTSRSESLRFVFRSLASHILVYTDTQKNQLMIRMPRKSIQSAPNSLYSKSDMWVPDAERKNFIYVGRLVEKKKPCLMIEAFVKASQDRENIGNLIIVGEGPEKEKCERLVEELNVTDKILFKGHVSDLDKLRHMYSESIASISPGYVGLSITQSFSFGTPMIVADDEPHAPEIEAAIADKNSSFFSANSSDSLKKSIIKMWDEKSIWSQRSESIIEHCKNNYSTEIMAKRIEEAFKLCQK